VKRREFIRLIGGAASWPLAARAQQGGAMRRIGVLLSSSGIDPEGQARIASLRLGLLELGWIEGRNITIDYRWGAGDPNQVRAQAARRCYLRSGDAGRARVPALDQRGGTVIRRGLVHPWRA
jgi:putative tryptophan/tyrosine transport system substrate-binding protein